MRLTYKVSIYVMAMLVWVGALTASNTPNDKKDFTKTIKKEFPINTTGLVKLSNRYGKVDLYTWDRDRVKVEVRITVRAVSEEASQRDFDRIEINFSDTPNMVSAETTIGEASKSSWFGWDSWNSKSDFSIDYQVFMPPTCDLELTNKYGDAFISSLTGDTRLNIKYGNFEFEGTEGDLDVYLGYGNGNIEQVDDLSADGAYCNLKVGKASDVDIKSKYSKIKIDEADEISSNSKYDTYHIAKAMLLKNEGKYDNINVGIINDVVVISKYTDLNIDRLNKSADCQMKYGGARMDDVAKGFDSIVLIGNYTNYKVNVEEGADVKVETDTDYATMKCPPCDDKDEFKSKGHSKGHIGKKDAQSIIRAQLNYGGLKVW